MVFNQSFKYLEKFKTIFIKVIPKPEYLLNQNINILAVSTQTYAKSVLKEKKHVTL